jgi:hypothetical protein
MKRSVIKSVVRVGLNLVVLGACASENLESTGLGPARRVAPEQPGMPLGPDPSTDETDSEAENPPGGGSGGEAPDPNLPLDGEQTEPNPPVSTTDDEMEPVAPPVAVPLTPALVGGALDGFLYLSPCQSEDFGHDCTLPGCQGGVKRVEQTLQLGGDPTVIYDVTIHVYGVVETRVYQGGERRGGNNFVRTDVDLWHAGGVVPAAPGTYNSYELHVQPPVDGAPNDYFVNSRTGNDDQSVVRINFEATFPVRGGGSVLWRSTDANCRQITNCDDSECGPLEPHPLTLAAVNNADPKPPVTFSQPYETGANVGRGQWVYIDVTAVAPRP